VDADPADSKLKGKLFKAAKRRMNSKPTNNPRASTLSSTRGSNPSVLGGPTEDELKQQQ
jgi:hypothetical protein